MKPLLALVLCIATGWQETRNLPSATPNADQKLVLRVSSQKTSYTAGSSIPLRIEILNQGPRQVLVGFLLDDVGGVPSNIKIRVLNSDNREEPQGYRLHLSPYGQDWGHGWWIPLEPGYFYGREAVLTPTVYPFLTKPGRYRVFVTYTHESTEQDGTGEKTGDRPEAKRSSSSRVFIGRVQSEPLEIEILNPKTSSP